jgi:hypothetical protein
MNDAEITQVKQNARSKAIEIWKSTTGAVSVDDSAPKN